MEVNALDPIRYQINAGDREGARVALAGLLEVEPDNADAWALLAILLGDPDEQARCYREILRIHPHDRQAQLWLESLARTRPPAQEPGSLPCPRCGATVKVRPLPGSPGGKMVCPSCGFPVGPAGAIGGKAPVRSDGAAPGLEAVPPGDELGRLLEEIPLPAPEPAIPPRQAERRGLLNGLLGRFRGSAAEPELEDLDMGLRETLAAGALSPELILRLAGGPLAPEDRRTCPHCGAVVSRREAKCPWCSSPLPDAEGQ